MRSDAKRVQNKVKPKRDGVINPQYYNFNEFKHGEFDVLKMLRINPKSTVELGYMCPRELLGPPAVTLTK